MPAIVLEVCVKFGEINPLTIQMWRKWCDKLRNKTEVEEIPIDIKG